MTQVLSDRPPTPLLASKQPIFRSGAVARMAGMPVATLRVWEQRYQAVKPTTAASGHRLYSTADIERVTLLRRLTEQGHAIGVLAARDVEQLRGLMNIPLFADPSISSDRAPQPTTLRIVVVGQALATRVRRSVGRERKGLVLHCVGVFDSLAQAAQAAQASQAAQHSVEPGVDLLLWQASSLQTGTLPELRAAQKAWHAQLAAVSYRFTSAAGRTELLDAGVAVFHEPADDESLHQWLASLKRNAAPADKAFSSVAPVGIDALGFPNHHVTAPRFGDLALTEFAWLTSEMACECPSHLAELLLQISTFETYSSECANRSEADARLHAYLQRVAGAARMLFETALEHVAVAEGLPLPPAPNRPARP